MWTKGIWSCPVYSSGFLWIYFTMLSAAKVMDQKEFKRKLSWSNWETWHLLGGIEKNHVQPQESQDTIRTEDFINTNQEHYCYATLLSMSNAKLTIICAELPGLDHLVSSPMGLQLLMAYRQYTVHCKTGERKCLGEYTVLRQTNGWIEKIM
jgi:hypothetical protein